MALTYISGVVLQVVGGNMRCTLCSAVNCVQWGTTSVAEASSV